MDIFKSILTDAFKLHPTVMAKLITTWENGEGANCVIKNDANDDYFIVTIAKINCDIEIPKPIVKRMEI